MREFRYQDKKPPAFSLRISGNSSLFSILFILLFTVSLGSALTFICDKTGREIEVIYLSQITTAFNQKKEVKPITIIFVGDIMLDRGVKLKVKKQEKGDWKFPFLRVSELLNSADLTTGNLEGPISNKGIRVGGIYSFRMDPAVIDGLQSAGFDILSLANNHILDYGQLAMEDTFSRLKETGIDYVGAGFNKDEAYSPIIKEVGKTKIAFLAFTNLGPSGWTAGEKSPGIAWLEKEKLEEAIKKAKEQADIIVVSFHFGDEYQSSSNSSQQFFAHLAIDSGADLVIGHHPHVVQEVEKYQKGYIAYSLGNFVFDQRFSEKTMTALLIKIIIRGGKIDELVPIKVKINDYFQPEILPPVENNAP